MKKILLITSDVPASNRKGWSGIPFSIKNELVKKYEVDEFCLDKRKSLIAILRTCIIRKVKKQFVSITLLKNYSKKASYALDHYLQGKTYDYILATHPSSAGVIAYSKTDIPIVLYSDCVLSNMYNYYWYNVDSKIKNEMDDIFQKALSKCARVVLTSDWAKEAAISDYGIRKEIIEVIPFGANVEIKDFSQKKHNDINILFVGVDWHRKGADVAVQCIEELNNMDNSRKYYLHLVGCMPDREIKNEYIKLYGFINRNIDSEREKLEEIRSISDVFLLPTKAECAGIVFCEACAYSLPSLTYDTGGIGNYVINGFNGYRLPTNATGKDFARKIYEIINNKNELMSLKENAWEKYKKDLNWEVAGERLSKTLESI